MFFSDVCAAIWHKPNVILWQDLKVCMCERAAARVFFVGRELAFPITFGIFAKDKITRKNSRCFGMYRSRQARKTYIAWLASRIIETWLNPENSTKEFAIIEAKRVLYPPNEDTGCFPLFELQGRFPVPNQADERKACAVSFSRSLLPMNNSQPEGPPRRHGQNLKSCTH